jgi:hypothetical protein
MKMSLESDSPISRPAPLPALFAARTHILGWQGMTVTLPESWNLTVFAGNDEKGNLRADDGDGPRLELRWENPKGSPDMERSIEDFLDRLEKDAEKRGQKFQRAKAPKLVQRSRKRKSQLVNFGWTGARSDEIIGQGWGLGWQCAECNRVVVAHLIGRGLENPGKMQKLASEVLDTLECHGSGGWRTWSVFDLQVELPEEFKLGRAKLMTGRLDLEWLKAPPPPPRGFGLPTERIAVRRLAAANVVLVNESFEDWMQRAVVETSKQYKYGKREKTTARTHEACKLSGHPRNLSAYLMRRFWDLVMRRQTPPVETTVWHCEPSNKLYIVDFEMSHLNTHVPRDVLDSIECHG